MLPQRGASRAAARARLMTDRYHDDRSKAGPPVRDVCCST
ncbi:hypothetical protein BZL30_4308 [Mycobacterium kansasii]|uniref:Uncharacterized protein n=1 Tax=Mycobacterium kansasii TaxID=1768 RepID=A0A1V3X9H8_MYCKA|nr:hypothetical protein BZL30_4308 [Mycobacterium kansasii]